MRIVVTRLAAAAAAVALSALPCAAPASAAPSGYTAFYTTSDYADVPRVVDYPACDGRMSMLGGHFAAVENRPAFGCVVQVSNNVSRWVTLCRGRVELSPAIRYNPTIRSIPGAVAPCPVSSDS